MPGNVIIQYKGFFDYGLLNKLLIDFMEYVKKNNIDSYFFKKVQILMVEMLENNYQYTHLIEDELKHENFEPEFKIISSDPDFKVIASNPILTNDAYHLKAYLDKINDLSRQDLKTNYKNILREGMYIKNANSGTGLIRIAKASKNKISYSFRKINNKLLYYTIEILVAPK